MIEWNLLEREIARRLGEEVRPEYQLSRRGLVGEGVGNDDGMLDGRELLLKLGDDRAFVVGLAAVAVAVGGDENFWLDLLEAIDDTRGTEVGRTARPDRAKAGGGDEGD